jgi:hypothetical protein
MSNVIDFNLERAVRKSGLHRAVCKEMIEDGFDPMDPDDIQYHGDWFSIDATLEMTDSWTEEALDRLWADIKALDIEE